MFSKGSTNAINIITGIALLGIIVGAFILTIVLSAFSGLKELHLQFTSVTDPQIKVFPVKGKFFTFSESQKQQLQQLEPVAHFSEIVESQVFLNYKDKKQYAILKGTDSNYAKVIPTDSILAYGNWDLDQSYQVVLGEQISFALGVGINNVVHPLELYMPKAGKGQITDPTKAFVSESVNVAGIYQLATEMDNKYVFSNIGLARKLLNLENTKVSNLEIKLTPTANESEVREALLSIFSNQIYIKNRAQLNDATYKMLKSENLMAYLVSTLVLIVALFNLVGAIIMMIIDKKKNLQTLYKMGATLTSIRQIFFLQGMLMTIIGGLIGVSLATAIMFLQKKYSLVMITYNIAYPVAWRTSNVFIVFLTLFVLGIIAALIASSTIQKSKIINS